MYLAYIDESLDIEGLRGVADPALVARFAKFGNNKGTVMSALLVPDDHWQRAFDAIRSFRESLRTTYGIRLRKELHATEFVAGRGQLGPVVVTKAQRAQIFTDFLDVLGQLAAEDCRSINVHLPEDNLDKALERLVSRVDRFLAAMGSRALLVFDAGHEAPITGAIRRMYRYHYVPSRFGMWPNGSPAMNIPLTRVVGDPFYRDSAHDYFLQAADFIAYALLRQDIPTPKNLKYSHNNGFARLGNLLVLQASHRDAQGVVRY